MAKIVRFHRLGGPEVLKIEDVPSREPAKGEVSLSVQAIGLNRAESMFMHGHYLELPKFPATLGLRSLWDRYNHRSECRPQLAEQACIDDTGILDESVWGARQRGHRSRSCFG